MCLVSYDQGNARYCYVSYMYLARLQWMDMKS